MRQRQLHLSTFPERVGRWLLAVCILLGLASLVTVLVVYPNGAPVSADPGAPVVPWWVVLAPALAGIALALVIPWRPPALPALATASQALRRSSLALLGVAVAFPVVAAVGGLSGLSYGLVKVLMLVSVAAVIVGALGGVRIDRPSRAWRWWAPAVVVAAWTLLSQVAPWNPRYDAGGIDPVVLLVSAVMTALTAGVAEELFYRRWLQTRLEAWLGPWPGIAVATLAFALMHFASHGTGQPLLDGARFIVAQGSFGLLMGVLWWRYRNLTAVVVAHILANGWQAAAALLS